jgi:hypothetical protein
MLTVMQDTSRIGLYHSPMMHYLAVRGIDEQSQSLRSAFFYTPNAYCKLRSSRFDFSAPLLAVLPSLPHAAPPADHSDRLPTLDLGAFCRLKKGESII